MAVWHDAFGLIRVPPDKGFPGATSGKKKNQKTLLPVQETQVRFLDQENPLEKETATHSSILAWKIPWTEEPGRL